MISGNPLNCDCFVRPLRRYFTEQLTLKEQYFAIRCHGPPYVFDEPLHLLSDDRLNCPRNVNTTRIMESQPGEYDITPDLKIRGVQK